VGTAEYPVLGRKKDGRVVGPTAYFGPPWWTRPAEALSVVVVSMQMTGPAPPPVRQLLVWVGLVAGLVAGLIALRYWMAADYLVNQGRVTEGNVVEEGDGGEGGAPAVVEFVHPVTGMNVTFEGGVGGVLGGGNQVGTSVAIRYDPADPTVLEIDSNFHIWDRFAIALLAAVALTGWSVGAIVSLRSGRNWPGV
jgi:hypothetical protein